MLFGRRYLAKWVRSPEERLREYLWTVVLMGAISVGLVVFLIWAKLPKHSSVVALAFVCCLPLAATAWLWSRRSRFRRLCEGSETLAGQGSGKLYWCSWIGEPTHICEAESLLSSWAARACLVTFGKHAFFFTDADEARRLTSGENVEVEWTPLLNRVRAIDGRAVSSNLWGQDMPRIARKVAEKIASGGALGSRRKTQVSVLSVYGVLVLPFLIYLGAPIALGFPMLGPTSWAYSAGCSPRLYRFLLTAGLDPNARRRFRDVSFSLLGNAARTGCSEVVDALLAAGADPNLEDSYGTALSQAASCGSEDTVSLLLHAGADPNLKDRSGIGPLAKAAGFGHAAVVQLLIGAGAEINPSTDSVNPLAAAAGGGHVEVVQALLEAGADLTRTPCIMIEAASGYEPRFRTVMEILLERGAKINCQADTTALIEAARAGVPASVEMLLRRGADRAFRDKEGKTALDVARENARYYDHARWRDCVALLTE